MNLIIDFGNTNVKIAVFDGKQMVYKILIKNSDFKGIASIEKLKTDFKSLSNAIVSSVVELKAEFTDYLKNTFQRCIFFNAQTPTPLINCYKSKNTLGYDRLAAAVGANHLFSNRNLLVIDVGTAITFDFVDNQNQYLGGNISAGIDMRFKALHTFTKKLPLIEKHKQWFDNEHIFGSETSEAIMNGVQTGILFEIEKYIDFVYENYADAMCVLTGGDIFFFVENIKKHIFAEPNIVEIGLNEILNYNLKP